MWHFSAKMLLLQARVIDRTKKNGNRSCLAFLSYVFLLNTIHHLLDESVFLLNQNKCFNMMIKMPK